MKNGGRISSGSDEKVDPERRLNISSNGSRHLLAKSKIIVSQKTIDKPFQTIDKCIVVVLVLSFTVMQAVLKLQAYDDDQGNPVFKQVLWSAMYLACGVRLMQLGKLKEVLATLNILWVFCAYMLATAVWSVDPNATIINSIELIGSTVIGCYLATRFTLSQFLSILTWLFSISIGLTALFLTVFKNHGYSFYGTGAWAGIFPEKNFLGASMSLGTIAFAAYFAKSTGRKRTAAAIGIVLCCILVFGSNSMTSMLDMVMVTLLIGSITLWRRSISGKIVVALTLITITLAYASGMTIDTLLAMVGRTPSLSGRDTMWFFLKEAIADRPIFGYGYNAFFRSEIAKPFFVTVVAFANRPPFHAHNSFLQIIVAGGYVGLIIFLIALLQSIIKSIIFYVKSDDLAAFWPIAVLLFLTLGSSDETYLPVINSFEWLVFIAATLYVSTPNVAIPKGNIGARLVRRSTTATGRTSEGNVSLRNREQRTQSIR